MKIKSEIGLKRKTRRQRMESKKIKTNQDKEDNKEYEKIFVG